MELQQYLDEIQTNKDVGDRCLFRGQSDAAWQLESGAFRRLKPTLSTNNKEIYQSVHLYYHRQLIESARRISSSDIDQTISDMQLLANLQHLGAGTGLLDFTWSSLVALWFAVSDSDFWDRDGKVYLISETAPGATTLTPRYDMLSSDDIMSQMQIDKEDPELDSIDLIKRNELHRFRYLIWEPPVVGDAGLRIFAQRSVFLIGRPQIDEEHLVNIIIPASSKECLLTELHDTDVSERTIFRDLVGFARTESSVVPYQIFNRANYHLKHGNDEYRNKRLKTAMAAYTLCIEVDKDRNEQMSELLFYRAHVCSDLLDFEQANLDYSEALEKLDAYTGQNLSADETRLRLACYFNRANVRSYIELLEEAIEDYKYVESVDKGFASDLYYNWANSLFKLGKYEDAVDRYKAQLEYSGTHFNSLVNLALTYVVLGQWSLAENTLLNAQNYGTLPSNNLEKVIQLNSTLHGVDPNMLRRVYLIPSDRTLFLVFSHPDLDDREVNLSLQGITGHSGNSGWGTMMGGKGLGGGPQLQIQLGGEM